MKLQLWSGVFWRVIGSGQGPYAYCPEHRIKLDILEADGDRTSQASQSLSNIPQIALICPTDDKQFPIKNGSFWTMQRHFRDALEAVDLQDAEIVDIDGYQIPIAKAEPPEKDGAYWVQARINDTKRGKQLVVYAGERGDRDKVQMFLDLENDKISFDQNNMHPNDVFARVVADFRSGRKAILEE